MRGGGPVAPPSGMGWRAVISQGQLAIARTSLNHRGFLAVKICLGPVSDVLPRTGGAEQASGSLQAGWDLQRAVCTHTVAVKLTHDLCDEILNLGRSPAMASTQWCQAEWLVGLTHPKVEPSAEASAVRV